MKRTLIAIFALGSMASAADFELNDLTAGTVVVNLNPTLMKDIAGNGFGGAGDAITFAKFTGTWQNNDTASLGIANNGSSTSHVTGLYNAWTKGTSTALNQDFKNNSLSSIFNSDTNWENIKDIAIAYSWDSSSSITGTNIYSSISYITKDNTVTTASGSLINQMKFDSVSYKLTATSLVIDDTYVTNSSYTNTANNLAGVTALSKGALVPEPATATLSLLALAGLCARRRRK